MKVNKDRAQKLEEIIDKILYISKAELERDNRISINNINAFAIFNEAKDRIENRLKKNK